ncbi:MAG: tRNA lysidine(34) synthetase TilS [Oscillospiraceae bacterium]|nr:tRNA lysidine(34) synthetase TilS [Oscillospiraceae bacterium]
MSAKIKDNLLKFSEVIRGNTVLVALSGGADSVCLLHALLEARDELAIEVEACHVNHMLRGEQSDSDEQFVRELCEKLGVKLHVGRVDVKSLLKKHHSLEEVAREVRYAFLEGTAITAKTAIIATAHNADDNAETVLLNLLRGTALRGLCGIPPVRGKIVRPLLECTKADILGYLEDRNIAFVTDETNFSEQFTRNALRLKIMPLLQEINPSLTAGITRMCGNLRADEEFLHEIAATALENAESGEFCRTESLINLHPAILNRIISLFLTKNNISPSNLRISGIVSLIEAENGGKINIAKDKYAIVKNNLLQIQTIFKK